MHASFLCLRDWGNDALWHVLHTAAQQVVQNSPGPLYGRAAVLLFNAPSAEDKLSFCAAVHALGGHALCLTPGEWRSDSVSLAAEGPVYGAGGDVIIVHALPARALEVLTASSGRPVLNGGNDRGHPCAALGDILFFQRRPPPLDTVRIAWIGGANGLAHSLIEAAMYIPFELFMALPEWGEPGRDMLGLALKAGAKIFLTRELHLALDGAHYVYVGAGPEIGPGKELLAGIPLTRELMVHARPDALVLAGDGLASLRRLEECLINPELHTERLECRLSVQKAVLPLLCPALHP